MKVSAPFALNLTLTLSWPDIYAPARRKIQAPLTKTTRKSGRSRIGRTLSLGQVAERIGFEPKVQT